jgi:membrane protein implicated in regulation of membrane protease activity
MAPLIWFVLAVTLLALAWSGADLDALLAAALAALALSLLTALMPLPALAVQLLLFLGGSAAVMVLLQRWSRRRAPAIPAGGSSDRASVISGFDAGQDGGRVRWQGQSWAATNLEPTQALPAGSAVVVMGREGNRLQVLAAWPQP